MNTENSKLNLLAVCLKESKEDFAVVDVTGGINLPDGFSYRYFEAWSSENPKVKDFFIRQALEMKVDYIVFLKANIIPESDALVKLWRKMDEKESVAVAAGAEDLFSERKDEIKSSEFCPLDFILINLYELCKKAPAPYFWRVRDSLGNLVMSQEEFFFKKIFDFTGAYPTVDSSLSMLYYDKKSDRVIGSKKQDLTYATKHGLSI